ncbi:MAG: hypothetical protein A4E66_02263 [Syntrophus sp. PtaB.Bin001]|nr:MAG: hypothetical protein A4E66_02263 [Syntrophus sp. PtaB.Bin001]
MGKLNVRSADDLDGFDDGVGILLEAFLEFGSDGEHGGRAVGISGVDAHGVDVFNEADGDHLIFLVANDFQFQFFPAEYGFFNQDLSNAACRYAAAGHRPEFFLIVDQAASRSAHSVCRTNHYGVTELCCDFFRLFHCIGRLALRHVDTQARHGFLEGYPVFAALDGVHLDADDLNTVFFQDSQFRQFRRQV